MPTTIEDLTEAVLTLGQSVNERMDATESELSDLRADADVTLSQPLGRKTEPDDLGGSTQRAQVHGPVARRSQTHGYGHFGEFAASVRQAGMPGGSIDEKLMAAAVTTNANEASGADGGFAVPPEYRAAIMEKAFGEDSLLARCMQVTVAGNQLTVPTSMTTPWSTDGIQAYWTGEAATITQSKPNLENVTVKLDKLAALIPVTEELLDDAPALGALVSSQAAEKIDYKLSDALAWGTGAGMPLGFMNAAALITQAKEGSQSADTIEAANVIKMASRLPVQSRTNAMWLIHPDAEHQLPLMTLGDQPIFMPPGGLRDSPFGRLLGRPVIPHQVCRTVGDLGDIMLVDLGKYLTAVKAGGLRSQTSIHMWFDQDITAFKFTLRVAGQPWWSEPTTAANGSFTQSPFVTLAARAYTPPQFVEAARTVLGCFDLDPASSNVANKTIAAGMFYSESDSGLEYEWRGRIWMNPPYASNLVGKFCNKFAETIETGNGTGIVLVNNASETGWWQRLASVSSVICFPKTRVKFLRPEGESGAPLQGQTIFYAGSDPAKFESEFRQFGFVVFCDG